MIEYFDTNMQLRDISVSETYRVRVNANEKNIAKSEREISFTNLLSEREGEGALNVS